jgi:hypothetical protein
MQAGRQARLGEKHRAEFPRADQTDSYWPAFSLTLQQESVQIHGAVSLDGSRRIETRQRYCDKPKAWRAQTGARQ